MIFCKNYTGKTCWHAAVLVEDTALRPVYVLLFQLTNINKLNPGEENKFQPKNGGQKTNLQLCRVQSLFCQQKRRNTPLCWTITRPFIPLLIFPFTLQRLVREKFHSKNKNPTFHCTGVKWSHFKFFMDSRAGRIVSWAGKIGKFLLLPEPLRLQDLKNPAWSRTEKKITTVIDKRDSWLKCDWSEKYFNRREWFIK